MPGMSQRVTRTRRRARRWRPRSKLALALAIVVPVIALVAVTVYGTSLLVPARPVAATSVTAPAGGVVLHDVIRDFLQKDLGPQPLAELNGVLLDAVAAG